MILFFPCVVLPVCSFHILTTVVSLASEYEYTVLSYAVVDCFVGLLSYFIVQSAKVSACLNCRSTANRLIIFCQIYIKSIAICHLHVFFRNNEV